MKKLLRCGTLLLFLTISGVFGNSDFSNKEYNEHIKNIKIYDENQTVIISKPFIIITNIKDKSVQNSSKEIVQMAIKSHQN